MAMLLWGGTRNKVADERYLQQQQAERKKTAKERKKKRRCGSTKATPKELGLTLSGGG